jgi:hypothetical protein
MPYRLVVSSVRPIRVVPIAIDNLQPTWDVSSFGMNLSREKSQHMRMCRYLSSQRYAKSRSLSGSIVDNRLEDSRFMPGIYENSLCSGAHRLCCRVLEGGKNDVSRHRGTIYLMSVER